MRQRCLNECDTQTRIVAFLFVCKSVCAHMNSTTLLLNKIIITCTLSRVARATVQERGYDLLHCGTVYAVRVAFWPCFLCEKLKTRKLCQTAQSQMYVIAAGYNRDISASNKTKPQKYAHKSRTTKYERYACEFNCHSCWPTHFCA